MARTSAGVYSAISNSWNPAVDGTTLDTSDWVDMLADIVAGLNSVPAITLVAGTTAVKPLTFASGPLNTTPGAGTLEYLTNIFYASYAASQRGVIPVTQIVTVVTGAKTALTNNSTGAQNIFASANDVITVTASTSYRFRARIVLNTGATDHITSFGLALTTATLTSINYNSWTTSSAASTLATPQMRRVATNSATAICATSTAVTTDIVLDGMFRVGTAGTMAPQITFSAGPTGTCEVAEDTYFEYWPIGTDTVVSIANAA